MPVGRVDLLADLPKMSSQTFRCAHHRGLFASHKINESTMHNNKYLFPALMQPSYALLPATSHPKAVGGMCYAVIKSSHQYAMPKSRFTSIRLKHQIIIN